MNRIDESGYRHNEEESDRKVHDFWRLLIDMFDLLEFVTIIYLRDAFTNYINVR
jgi:hypothetical protein